MAKPGRKKQTFTPWKVSRSRDYYDPLYKQWRQLVRRRDRWKCQMPNCISTYVKHKLHCHHIKTWAQNPHLRYDVTNGITLCPDCHKLVTGNEAIYEALFLMIVYRNSTR